MEALWLRVSDLEHHPASLRMGTLRNGADNLVWWVVKLAPAPVTGPCTAFLRAGPGTLRNARSSTH